MTLKQMKRLAACTLALTAFATRNADAAGFAITDYSMTGLGRAYAGAGVVGDDYSAIAFNPAGMTLLKSGAQAGAALIWEHGKVSGSASKGSSANIVSGKDRVHIPALAPNMFAQYALSDWRFGIGIYAPFGLASKYKKDWFGSDYGIDSELKAIDIAPSVAYKINDYVSVGGSIIARYGMLKMTNSSSGTGHSDFDIDGWNVYGRLGIMIEPNKDTRFGLAYQTRSTEVEHTLKGTHKMRGMPVAVLNGEWDGATVTSLPESWTLSGYHRHGDFGYSALLRYTRWEHFDEFTLTSSGMLGYHTSKYDWENTWTVSLGLDWYYSEDWTFRAGVAYDESPVRGAYTRTARIPDNDRYWMSVGATRKINNKMKVDFGFMHLYLPTYKARNGYSKTRLGESQGNIDAKYDVNAEVLGVQFQYDF